MERLYDFTPGQVAFAHDRYLVAVWAKWEKVGQHQRTWYLCSRLDEGHDYPELLSDPSIELLAGEVTSEKKFVFTELPDLTPSMAVLSATDLTKDYGWAYGVVSADFTSKTWSLGRAGSGYPWWLKEITPDLVVADSWRFFGEHLEDDDETRGRLWEEFLQAAPKLTSFVG